MNYKTALLKRPIILVACAYLTASALVFRYGTDFLDEGLLYQWGMRIISGELPYTDFFLQMAPGTFYLHAGLIKLFGVSMFIGRIFKQIQGLFVIILTYLLIMQALKNKRAALISAVIASAWSGALHVRYHWYTMDAGLLILLGVYCFIRFIQTSQIKWLAVSGLCIGISILFKQNMGIAVFSAAFAVFILQGIIKKKIRSAVKYFFIFTIGVFLPLALFILYYAARGGDIHQLYLQTILCAGKVYGYGSLFEILFFPFKVASLVYRQDLRYPIGALLLLSAFFIILAKSKPYLARIIAAFFIISVIFLNPGIFSRFFVWTQSFIFFIIAIVLSGYDMYKNPGSNLSLCRLCLSMFAFANFYGGIMVGSGLGRFVETMTGSFYAYGVLVDLIENSAAVRALWHKFIWWGQRQFVYIFTFIYVIVGLAMIIQNTAFYPQLDFPLYRLNRMMRIRGAWGIIGEKNYVTETEAVVDYAKRILVSNDKKKEIFVFPLNPMFYPLLGAKNPTAHDTLASIPFIKEFIPDMIAQLRKTRPQLIIMQKMSTPTTALLTQKNAWVLLETVEAVGDFVKNNYKKIYETPLYYEVYGLK